MTQKSKTAKFFCENCGAEVSRNAKVCRHCGRFFSSVRCPQCGKTGTPEEFSKGCPACGYTVESSAKNEKRLLKKEKKAPFLKRKALKNQINRFNNQTKSEKKEYRPTKEILASINGLEKQFKEIMAELEIGE